MNTIYNPWKYGQIDPDILRPDFEEMKAFEPALVDEALTITAIAEWLEGEYDTVMSNTYEPGVDKAALHQKAAMLKELMDAKKHEKEVLWLQLRICELIHKYDLKDEVER